MLMKHYAILALFISLLNCLASQDEFKVKRESDYSFQTEPKVTKKGDSSYLIEFETKSFCDATVYIQDESGKILRHIASGVLGEKAPEPFQLNSKLQKIEWDG